MEISWDDLTRRRVFPVCRVWLAELSSSLCNKQLFRTLLCLEQGKFYFLFLSPWLKRTVLWEMAIVFTVIWWWNVICLKYFCDKLFHSIKPSIVRPVYKCNLHYNALRNPRWKTLVHTSSYQQTHKRACLRALSFSLFWCETVDCDLKYHKKSESENAITISQLGTESSYSKTKMWNY